MEVRTADSNNESHHSTLFPKDVQLDLLNILSAMLPSPWQVYLQKDFLQIARMSSTENFSVQRSICLKPDGSAKVFVHCQPLLSDHELMQRDVFKEGVGVISLENVNGVVRKLLNAVNAMQKYSICWGEENYKEHWDSVRDTSYCDHNVFSEGSSNPTLRSKFCCLLVFGTIRGISCLNCKKVSVRLRKINSRSRSKGETTPHPNKPNMFMSNTEMKEKLSTMKTQLDRKSQTIVRLRARINQLLSKESVKITHDLSNDNE